jgi:hypothetical protein
MTFGVANGPLCAPGCDLSGPSPAIKRPLVLHSGGWCAERFGAHRLTNLVPHPGSDTGSLLPASEVTDTAMLSAQAWPGSQSSCGSPRPGCTGASHPRLSRRVAGPRRDRGPQLQLPRPTPGPFRLGAGPCPLRACSRAARVISSTSLVLSAAGSRLLLWRHIRVPGRRLAGRRARLVAPALPADAGGLRGFLSTPSCLRCSRPKGSLRRGWAPS